MRRFLALAFAAAALAVLPATAGAQTTYESDVAGFEIAATSTSATFLLKTSGDLPGFGRAVILRTPFDASGASTITGGSFELLALVSNLPANVTGEFSGGSVTRTSSGPNCTNETFLVSGTLSDVSIGEAGGGTGSFAGVLTHLRAAFPFLGCRVFSALYEGELEITG